MPAMLEPEVETRSVGEQFQLDDLHFRRQLAYLVDRSPFYREKLAKAGFRTAEAIGGLDRIADLPFTEKQKSAQAARRKIRSARISRSRATNWSASIRPAAPPGRRATFR